MSTIYIIHIFLIKSTALYIPILYCINLLILIFKFINRHVIQNTNKRKYLYVNTPITKTFIDFQFFFSIYIVVVLWVPTYNNNNHILLFTV